MDTLAVVCDDNIECAEDRDEAQCKDGTDKYDPIVYAMTALMGLVYVVIKLHWFFYQRHQPVGDEDDDDMEMEEMESNQEEQEVNISKLVLIKFHKQSLSGNGGRFFSNGFYQIQKTSGGGGQSLGDCQEGHWVCQQQ